MRPRDRRGVRIGGAIVIAAALGLRVLPWAVRQVGTWRTGVAARAATLGREQALLASAPRLEASLDHRLRRVVALAPALLAGRTSAEATATLASLLTLGATRHGLRVLSVDPLPDSAAGVFDRVALHAGLEGDVHGLVTLLAALETGAPLLTVTQLSVEAPAPAAARSTAEALQIGLTVQGYALRGAMP